jgi:hypothetical protein
VITLLDLRENGKCPKKKTQGPCSGSGYCKNVYVVR